MKLKTRRLTQLPTCVDQVKTWQRYLKSKGVYSGSIRGSFDVATEAATEKYRQKTYLRAPTFLCCLSTSPIGTTSGRIAALILPALLREF